MYERYSQGSCTKTGRSSRAAQTHRQNKHQLRRFRQLMACICIFLVVFVGKGVFPDRVNQLGGNVLVMMGENTDFRQELIRLGQALGERGGVAEEVSALCMAVFGPAQEEWSGIPREYPALLEQERQFLAGNPDYEAAAKHFLRLEEIPQAWLPKEAIPQTQVDVPAAEVPAVGTVLLQVEDLDQQPPEGHTMDHLSFGELETYTPVIGQLWSGYGYRTHPIDGEYRFHSGVDIGADEGEKIGAFASGVVEYVGESDAYGNYLQLDHGEGIKSFYAHCSTILVKRGQQVEIGEPIAQVGSTGSATGPHLHLELKCGGLRVDPSYYIRSNIPS